MSLWSERHFGSWLANLMITMASAMKKADQKGFGLLLHSAMVASSIACLDPGVSAAYMASPGLIWLRWSAEAAQPLPVRKSFSQRMLYQLRVML